MPAKFDVFLSHASPDKPLVEVLGKRLMAENLRPWLDKWNLIPGEPWQPQIELALADCIACAVFIGSGDRGPWHEEELRTAIRRRVERREQAFRVIPVLLPGAKRTELPDFLTATTWVEFRDLDDTEAFDRLLCGIRGIEPGLGKQGAVYEGRNPYRGLELFDVNDAPLFFGRQELTGRLLDALKRDPSGKESRFLAIVGASGSGKSSVARAGLLAALKVGKLEGSQTWPQAICLPGSDPFFNLANAMKGVAQESDRVLVFGHLKERRDGVKSLDQATNLVLGEPPRAERLVLLVDQFEEVFTLCENEADRRDFIAMLLHASKASRGRTIVVLTLRADFYHRCAAHADLAAMLSNHQILFGPMTDSELREAIVSPAQRAGLVPDPGLVQILVDYVVGRVGALPALQFTLQQVWQHREANRLTIGAYNKIGKIEGALGRKADEIYNAFSPEEKDLCRRVFLRLVQPGEGSEDTRRRASLSELVTDDGAQSQAIQAVIAKLTDPNSRLLTTERQQSASGQGTIEVAHEALIRGWPEFRKWIDADRAGIRTHLRLTEAAKEWTEADTDSKKQEALLTGGRLLVASEWAVKHPDELSVLEKNFLSASEEHERQTKADEAEKNRRLAEAEHARAEAERQRAEEAEKREIAEQRRVEDLKKTTLRLTHSVAALVLSLFVVVWLVGRLNDKAKLAEERAAIATSRQLADLSVRERDKHLDRSLILAAEAFRFANTFEARESLFEAIQNRPGFRLFLHIDKSYVTSMAFSPDGKTIAAGYGDGKGGGIALWDADARKQIAVAPHPQQQEASSVAFSPCGTMIAVANRSGKPGVALFDVVGRKWLPDEPLVLKEGGVLSVAFSPDGKTLAAGYWTGNIRDSRGWMLIWDIIGRKKLTDLPLPVPEARDVSSVVFSPDGNTLAAGYERGVVIWDAIAQTWLTKKSMEVPEGYVSCIAFSRENKTIAVGYNGNLGKSEVVLWDAVSQDKLGDGPLQVPEGVVSSVAFSPDGSTLAAGYRTGGELDPDREDQGGVLKWNTLAWKRTPEKTITINEGGVSSVAFSPDGKTIAAGYGRVKMTGISGGVVLCDTVSTSRLVDDSLAVSHGGPSSVAFSPDGKTIAAGYVLGAGSDADEVILWDANDPERSPRQSFKLRRGSGANVAFSPDGNTMAASAGYTLLGEGGVVFWNTKTQRLLSGQPITEKRHAFSSVTFSPDGKTLATGYGFEVGGVAFWDVATGKKRPGELLLGHKGGVTDVAFSPDGKTLAAGYSHFGCGIAIWDTASRTLLSDKSLCPQGYDGVSRIAFHPDGKTLAVGYDRGAGGIGGVVVLLDANGQKSVTDEPIITAERGDVTSLAFSPDGETLAAGYNDEYDRDVRWVILWHVTSQRRLIDGPLLLKGGVESLAFSPDSKNIAVGYRGGGDKSGGISLWDVDPESWKRIAGEIANRNLTRQEWREYFPDEKTYHKTFDWLEPPQDTPVASQKVK